MLDLTVLIYILIGFVRALVGGRLVSRETAAPVEVAYINSLDRVVQKHRRSNTLHHGIESSPPAPETTARARKHSQKWQCNRSDVINLLIGYIMIQQRSTITQRLHSSEMVSKKKFKHLCAKPIHEPWLILHKYIQNAGTFRIICNEFHVKLAQFSHGHSRSMQALTSCFMSQCPTTKVIWAVLVKRDNPSYII